MKRELTESQIENLIELVEELQWRLKKKNAQLTVSRNRLNNAKRSIKRLQGIVSYQRERILKLYGNEGVQAEVSKPLLVFFTNKSRTLSYDYTLAILEN